MIVEECFTEDYSVAKLSHQSFHAGMNPRLNTSLFDPTCTKSSPRSISHPSPLTYPQEPCLVYCFYAL